MVKSPEAPIPMSVDDNSADDAEKRVAKAVNKIGSGFGDEERKRLIELRILQNRSPEDLDSNDANELIELQQAETRHEKRGGTAIEGTLSQQELQELTHLQIRSTREGLSTKDLKRRNNLESRK